MSIDMVRNENNDACLIDAMVVTFVTTCSYLTISYMNDWHKNGGMVFSP